MQRADQCIKKAPRLIYKAGDKATGIKKNKQPTKGSGSNLRRTEKSADGQRTHMAWVTRMLQRRREGPWEDCGRNAIMWTNAVKSKKVDYTRIQMLGVDFLFTEEESGPRYQQWSDGGRFPYGAAASGNSCMRNNVGTEGWRGRASENRREQSRFPSLTRTIM